MSKSKKKQTLDLEDFIQQTDAAPEPRPLGGAGGSGFGPRSNNYGVTLARQFMGSAEGGDDSGRGSGRSGFGRFGDRDRDGDRESGPRIGSIGSTTGSGSGSSGNWRDRPSPSIATESSESGAEGGRSSWRRSDGPSGQSGEGGERRGFGSNFRRGGGDDGKDGESGGRFNRGGFGARRDTSNAEDGDKFAITSTGAGASSGGAFLSRDLMGAKVSDAPAPRRDRDRERERPQPSSSTSTTTTSPEQEGDADSNEKWRRIGGGRDRTKGTSSTPSSSTTTTTTTTTAGRSWRKDDTSKEEPEKSTESQGEKDKDEESEKTGTGETGGRFGAFRRDNRDSGNKEGGREGFGRRREGESGSGSNVFGSSSFAGTRIGMGGDGDAEGEKERGGRGFGFGRTGSSGSSNSTARTGDRSFGDRDKSDRSFGGTRIGMGSGDRMDKPEQPVGRYAARFGSLDSNTLTSSPSPFASSLGSSRSSDAPAKEANKETSQGKTEIPAKAEEVQPKASSTSKPSVTPATTTPVPAPAPATPVEDDSKKSPLGKALSSGSAISLGQVKKFTTELIPLTPSIKSALVASLAASLVASPPTLSNSELVNYFIKTYSDAASRVAAKAGEDKEAKKNEAIEQAKEMIIGAWHTVAQTKGQAFVSKMVTDVKGSIDAVLPSTIASKKGKEKETETETYMTEQGLGFLVSTTPAQKIERALVEAKDAASVSAVASLMQQQAQENKEESLYLSFVPAVAKGFVASLLSAVGTAPTADATKVGTVIGWYTPLFKLSATNGRLTPEKSDNLTNAEQSQLFRGIAEALQAQVPPPKKRDITLTTSKQLLASGLVSADGFVTYRDDVTANSPAKTATILLITSWLNEIAPEATIKKPVMAVEDDEDEDEEQVEEQPQSSGFKF